MKIWDDVCHMRTTDYIRAFGLWYVINSMGGMWFRELFHICPDCGRPRWWKAESHDRCIPF